MLLDAYREVYFTGGVSSVYLWEEEEAADGGASASAAGSFAGCFLILKRVGGDGEEGPVGAWESSHVVQVCGKKDTWHVYVRVTAFREPHGLKRTEVCFVIVT